MSACPVAACVGAAACVAGEPKRSRHWRLGRKGWQAPVHDAGHLQKCQGFSNSDFCYLPEPQKHWNNKVQQILHASNDKINV